MKKMLAVILAVFGMAAAVSGCGGAETKTEGKLSVVTTIFPEYDWVSEIARDKAEITMLLDNGIDLHSYQPTAADIMRVADCDMFIYVGGESDDWVEDALKEAVNEDMVVINLLDVLGNRVKEEEAVEGMEAEEEEDAELDEHIWLSLRNAEILCGEIAERLAGIDRDNAEFYRANAKAYIEKLAALDEEYKSVTDAAGVKTLLFGDRFPFRYLTDDYGLSYYAAFAGCSAETEASFETVAFLADKLDELKLGSVIKIEGSDEKLAKTIIENTENKNQSILTLNSMQATTSKDAAEGVTYYSIMQNNLEVLKEALEG